MQKYILRTNTDSGVGYLDQVSSLIKKKLGVPVEIVNHRWLDPRDFNLNENDYIHVSLDKHLAEFFNIHYFQVSRVFNIHGDVIGRIFGDVDDLPKNDRPYHIVDTDMVHGDTIKAAMRRIKADSYTVPIKVGANEDLIDVEDLLMKKSIVYNNMGAFEYCSYLINPLFFSKRTSLPEYLYQPMCEIFDYKA